jgi:hypothetical protein
MRGPVHCSRVSRSGYASNRDFRLVGHRLSARHALTAIAQIFDVEFDRIANQSHDRWSGLCDRHATGQVGHKGAVALRPFSMMIV